MLFAGDIDIGYIGPSPAVNGFVQSHGQVLRIIAGAASGGVSLVVRSAANIHSAKDLSGKKVTEQVMSVMVVIIVIGVAIDSLVFGPLERRVRDRWNLTEDNAKCNSSVTLPV